MKKTIAILCLAALLLGTMVGCSSKAMTGEMEYGGAGDQAMSPDEQADNVNGWYSADSLQGSVIEGDEVFAENPFIKTAKQAVSTFSADVDTASYSYFRKLVGGGYGLNELIDMAGASIRTEEMINYFDYSYNLPKEGELFGTSVQIAPSPWNENAKLMVLGLATEQPAKRLDNNLVFLIDVSGSMSAQDKLPLLKNAFSQLVEQLNAQDTVSIVTYSGKEEIVLEGCMGSKSEQILAAVNGLKASGSTNGEAGLQQAYELAARYFKEDGNNRIIMASDGDLNVGISSEEELEKFVEQKRESGIYLSVLGFGTGNYKDSKMETIANHGNGIYYYIDGASEAERVFGSKLLSTLQTVGTDVKLQVTFDPSMVDSYRLVGYENRLMKEEDFKDDSKDGGEVGAGHALTVCYELILTDAASTAGSTWMELAVRYKAVGESVSREEKYALGANQYTDTPNEEFRFVSCVIRTAMLLHRSRYAKEDSLGRVIADLRSLTSLAKDAEKTEFVSLLELLANHTQ